MSGGQQRGRPSLVSAILPGVITLVALAFAQRTADWTLYVVWMLVLNVATFIAYARDKSLAQQHRFRISERTLFMLMISGGVIGAWMAMVSRRHKTKHLSFKAAIVFSLLLHIGLLIALGYIGGR